MSIRSHQFLSRGLSIWLAQLKGKLSSLLLEKSLFLWLLASKLSYSHQLKRKFS
jgi:hypothetical protein